MASLSILDYIAQQSKLEEEARESMPWSPKYCTYEKGPLRQQIYACRTHNNIGICYSCSIQCHFSCDIVELFTKRHFTCDCGTERDTRIKTKGAIHCEIRKNRVCDVAALDNRYGQNFKGLFCSCSTEYNPNSDAVMLQCILGLECNEDWFHDYCIMGISESRAEELREKTSSDPSTGERFLKGFPKIDSFDAFVCWRCASKYRYYFDKIMSHQLGGKVIASMLPHCTAFEADTVDNSTERNKRKFRDTLDTDTSSANEYSLFLKEGYSAALRELKDSITDKKEKLYVFLDKIAPMLIDDEPVYELPEDDDSEAIDSVSKELSSNIQPEALANGVAAIHSLQSKLKFFFKSFAETGRVVTEDDVKNFFEEKT